ncbi:MAG: putative lipid II flippase MurJ [Patescibacteria group bacterium]|nr:MAG: putative lipid II flippase MurJ [Patescibacteria group bacterium]
MFGFSRVLGFVRYRVFSYFFTVEQLDLFFASFRLPDLIFDSIVSGVLGYSLIPIILRYKKRSKEDFYRSISVNLNLFMLFLLIVVVLSIIFADYLVKLITPGFNLRQQDTVVYYTRIILATQVPFLTIGSILSSFAQVERRFLFTALAPLAYNLSIILTTLVFANKLGLFALILGVVIGSFLYAISQLGILRLTDFVYVLSFKPEKSFKDFVFLSSTRVVNLAVKQLESTVELALSTLLGLGSYTSFYLAQRLQFLPVSLIGQSISQAAYPFISSLSEQNRTKQIAEIIKNNTLLIIFTTVPISFFLIFARTPIVRVFFGGEKFDWTATVTTAYTVSMFAYSIPFHSLFYLYNKTYFALFKTKVPLIFNSLFTFVSILLSYYFILYLDKQVWYLALAFTITNIVNTLFLGFYLNKKFRFVDYHFVIEIGKIYLITFLSAVVSYNFMRLVDGLFIETINLITLLILLFFTFVVFGSMFIFLSWLVDIKQFLIIPRVLSKIDRYRKSLIQYFTSVE